MIEIDNEGKRMYLFAGVVTVEQEAMLAEGDDWGVLHDVSLRHGMLSRTPKKLTQNLQKLQIFVSLGLMGVDS